MPYKNELIQERIRELFANGKVKITSQQRRDLAAEFECTTGIIGNAVWIVSNPSGHRKYYVTHQAAGQNGRMVLLGRGDERVSSQEWREILDRYDHQCAFCGSSDDLQMDHIFPIAQGGKHAADNIQPLCKKCNRKKGDNASYPPFKTVTLRQGDTWVVMAPTPQTATVEVLNRNTVVLRMDDGEIIKLVR